MTTINPHYTHLYSQPNEYQFSHDSVFLARFVFEQVRQLPIHKMEILDLCAGCGIIGFDFVFHCEKELHQLPTKIDFLEVQDIYETHFLKNKLLFKNLNAHFLKQNYSSLLNNANTTTYDLILCNPPYFLKEHGKLSPSVFKNRCRFFLDSDLETLVHVINKSLRSNGNAFVLIKESEPHKYFPIKLLKEQFKDILNINITHNIRGTDVVHITKVNS